MSLRKTLQQAWNRRKAERRVNKMFDTPQGVDRRKTIDRRLEGMPTHKP